MSGPVSHYIDQLARLLQGISACAAGRIDDAFAQQRQFQKLTSFEWKIDDLLILNHIFDLRGLDLEQPRAALDGNRLRLLSKFELKILPNVIAYVKRNSFLDGLLKPGDRDCELVFAEGKLRQQEQARFICYRVELLLSCCLRGKNGGARYRRAGRVLHLSGDFACVHLSERGSRVQDGGADEDDNNAEEIR